MLENDAQQLGCFSDIADHHGGLVEVRRDFKRAAERLDVRAKLLTCMSPRFSSFATAGWLTVSAAATSS